MRLEDAKNQYKGAMLELQEAEKEVSTMRAEIKLPAGATQIRKDGQPVRRCQHIMFTSAIGPDSMAGWTTTNRALPRSSRRFVA